MHDFRMALADDAEPDGWRLLRDRKEFSQGKKVTVNGEPYRIVLVGRIRARFAVRTLIALFGIAYLGVIAVGGLRVT